MVNELMKCWSRGNKKGKRIKEHVCMCAFTLMHSHTIQQSKLVLKSLTIVYEKLNIIFGTREWPNSNNNSIYYDV